MQVNQTEVDGSGKTFLLPWVCFSQIPLHFSIVQGASKGRKFLPFPWSTCNYSCSVGLSSALTRRPFKTVTKCIILMVTAHREFTSSLTFTCLLLQKQLYLHFSSHRSNMQVSAPLALPVIYISDLSKPFPEDRELSSALGVLVLIELPRSFLILP